MRVEAVERRTNQDLDRASERTGEEDEVSSRRRTRATSERVDEDGEIGPNQSAGSIGMNGSESQEENSRDRTSRRHRGGSTRKTASRMRTRDEGTP